MNCVLDNSSWFEVIDPQVLAAEPMVSVHMITYNHAPYLPQAIEGVLAQRTQYPFELVIGDDCSKDCTRNIALHYQQRFPSRIRVLCSKTNAGMLANSDRVAAACRGKYIAYCEGDDYWTDPLKLETQIGFLEGNPGHVMIHNACKRQSGSKIEETDRAREWPSGSIFEDLLVYNFIVTCTVCIRSEVQKAFRESEFNDYSNLMGDYPCWLFASQRGLIAYLNKPQAIYRQVAGSATNRGHRAALRMLQSTRKVREQFIRAFGCSPECLQRTQLNANLQALMLSALAGDVNLFDQEFHWFRKNNPHWRSDYRNHLRRVLLHTRLDGLLRLRLSVDGWLRDRKLRRKE